MQSNRISPNRIVVKQTCQGWKYQPAVKWVFGMVRSLTLKMDINMGLWKEALRSCKEIDTPLL
jgi:hypothetical protein